jgi:PHD/YefM family antitoxin component YafN of YafNO toxin-antitoxin module
LSIDSQWRANTQPTPQIVPISDFRLYQDRVLNQLGRGPVIFAQRGRPAAALVYIEERNRVAAELAHYKRLVMLEERSREVAAGNYVTQDEVEQGLRARGLID